MPSIAPVAPVVAMLVACGDGIGSFGKDAPAPARIELTVRVADDADVGIAGARVYAQTADDLVEASALTGSDGMVSIQAGEGGTITVDDGLGVTTFAGVKGGDMLVVPHLVAPTIEVPLSAALPSGASLWTSCGVPFSVAATSMQLPRCADTIDVLIEDVQAATYSIQTLADVDTATVDVAAPRAPELVESVTVHGATNAQVVQWLITEHGRLELSFPLFSGPRQFPDLPGAMIKTVVQVTPELDGLIPNMVYVVDTAPLTATYEIDVASELPPAIPGFRQVGADLQWTDDGRRPADVAIVQHQRTTVIAPITYADGVASVHLPVPAGVASLPPEIQLSTFRIDGAGYDAVRGQAAVDAAAFAQDIGPMQFSQAFTTARLTPPHFIVEQIHGCGVSSTCR